MVPGYYLGKGQVQCEAPILEGRDGVVECAVDVAINRIDFTDAGVVFTFHGFNRYGACHCAAPQGRPKYQLPLSPDAGDIDEDGSG